MPRMTLDEVLADMEKTFPDKCTMTIDDALEKWLVAAPGLWENDQGPADWYAVMNDDSIVAYFANEADACRWRLSMVNRDLNP